MINLDIVNLETLGVPKIYRKILKYHGLSNGLKLIEALEDYKMSDRELIITGLNSLVESKDDIIYNVTEDTIQTNNEVINTLAKKYGSNSNNLQEYTMTITRPLIKQELPEDVVESINRYNVSAELISNKLFIYHTLDDTFSKELVEVDLYNYKVRFVCVTPGNLRELKGESQKKLDNLLVFRRLIVQAIMENSANLKLECIYSKGKPTARVRMRVDRTVITCNLFQLTVDDVIEMIKQAIQKHSELTLSSLDTGKAEGSFTNIIFNDKIECRFSASQTDVGYYMNVRIQLATQELRDIRHLNFDQPTVDVLSYVEDKTAGITLITGAMNSGKSWTLWGLMTDILKKPVSCIEYSSPVESRQPLPQINYGNDLIKLEKHLQAARKQDLNYAFINEIPSGNVSVLALDLANSNVHVISTLHLSRIWELPHKLYTYHGNAFKDTISSFNLVLYQKLYVQQCPYCTYSAPTATLPNRMKQYLESHEIYNVLENRGCDKCHNGELKGKLKPYVEWFLFTPEIISKLRTCNTPSEMEEIMQNIVLHDKEYVEKKVALDYKLLNAVKAKELSYKVLYDII